MSIRHFIFLVIAVLMANFSVQISEANAVEADTMYVVSEYSPERSPQNDLKLAKVRAKSENKYILLEVGGEWCVWCHILDRYIVGNNKVHAAFVRSFLIVKINVSPENENAAFLSNFPEVAGYPHLIVLDENGRYLAQQDTGELENGRSYDQGRMLQFAKKFERK